MKPFNRHVLVRLEEEKEEKTESLIVLPTDYKKPESPYQVGMVLNLSDDCTIDLSVGDKIVFEKRTLQEIEILGIKHYLILENYIYGRI